MQQHDATDLIILSARPRKFANMSGRHACLPRRTCRKADTKSFRLTIKKLLDLLEVRAYEHRATDHQLKRIEHQFECYKSYHICST